MRFSIFFPFFTDAYAALPDVHGIARLQNSSATYEIASCCPS